MSYKIMTFLVSFFLCSLFLVFLRSSSLRNRPFCVYLASVFVPYRSVGRAWPGTSSWYKAEPRLSERVSLGAFAPKKPSQAPVMQAKEVQKETDSNSKLLISRDTCGTLPHFSVSNSIRQKRRFLNQLNSASELNSAVSVVLCNICDSPSSDEFLTCRIQ